MSSMYSTASYEVILGLTEAYRIVLLGSYGRWSQNDQVQDSREACKTRRIP